MNDLTGKVAIVTGASKGIGAAVARALAGAGAAVVVNYATDRDGADRTVADITAAGGKAVAVQGDVAKADDVARLFTEARDRFGAPSIVVNNAAFFAFEPVNVVTEETYRRHFDTNVWGAVLTAQEALKHFPSSGGSIVNIGSIASENPSLGTALYSATKGALDTLSLALAKELGPRGIRVNTVAPGGTDTEGARRIGIIGGDRQQAMIDGTPLGRYGQPEDIAPTVVFLASDDAAWLTGERISASGGLH